MKVIQINALGKTMSTGRTTREMHNYFKTVGIDSYIVCPARLDCDDVYTFSSRNLMRLDTVLTMLTGLEAHHSYFATLKLIKYLKKIRPDIVHLRVLHNNCFNLPLLFNFLSKSKIAVVITLHDFWFITGKCFFYGNLKCSRWMSGCHNCPMPNSKKRPYLFERSKRMWIDKKKHIQKVEKLAFVGVSNWVKSQALMSNICNGKIVEAIYNWVDLNIFFPHESTIFSSSFNIDKKVVLGVAAKWVLNDRKGLDKYIDLAKKLPQEYIIALVGKIEQNVRLPNNIISLGQIESTKTLSDIYSSAFIYLNLSGEETFGKVSAESLSCGTPVVAIDTEVNRELIFGHGLLIPDYNPELIVNALVAIDNDNYYSLSKKCREYAVENFGMEANINKYLDLYRRVLLK